MRTPAFWYRSIGWQAVLPMLLLWPLSLFYRCGRMLHVKLVKLRYLPWPVICVGNLVAGGAGKTPTVLALAELLADTKPHVVTRGFGGTHNAPRRVTEDDTAISSGDEALLLAEVAPTWVARDRALGIGCAIAAGARLVLLDDGLQSVNFRARVNLLVVDGASGFGNGAILPSGPLRERPADVRARIDALIMIGDDAHKIAARFPDKPIFRADPEYDLSALDRTGHYLAFAGLARPEKFFTAARAQGLQIIETRAFADHYPYTPEDRAALLAAAKSVNAQLLTTAKDAMRWPVLQRMALNILPLQLRFTDPAGLRDFLKTRCGEAFSDSFNGH